MENTPQSSRRSLRLRSFDYSSAGAYFVTICTQAREPLFGTVEEDRVRHTPVGDMVAAAWREIPARHPAVAVDQFVVMPDHLHGILILTLEDRATSARESSSLSSIIGAFKSITTHRYAVAVRAQGWRPFPGRLWQRGFYEHVIRNEDSLSEIREYIAKNPVRWSARSG